MSDLATAIGLVLVIEGLLYAVVPGRLKSMMAAAEKLPEDALRTGGVMAVGAGVAIIWLTRTLAGGS